MNNRSVDIIERQSKTHFKRRLCLKIQGIVQGVGFRPFIYRLATELKLTGWIINSTEGVQIEVEGKTDKLAEFIDYIDSEKPVLASIVNKDISYKSPVGYSEFIIRPSEYSGNKNMPVLPDIATCPDCLEDIFNPDNRRYRYPFTNCTNCGPRYSIIESLPYDRINTTMKIFPMCENCRAEYEDPLNRRFHAQPNACPKCGPNLELWNTKGEKLSSYDKCLLETCRALEDGKIVALKGLGGFQLLVDARNDEAVKQLRKRKNRKKKPFAMMYPHIDAVKKHCDVNELEEKLLVSHKSPIVLLKCREQIESSISPDVAPGNPYFGIMLPYTPLHHLILAKLNIPLVATSGNISDEPICIDEYEALERLKNIADLFLVHNRPIARQVDDSVVRVMMNREAVLRSARGYAPTTIQLKKTAPLSLAVGGHLKNTIAISIDKSVFISQHIGDLETRQAHDTFFATIRSLSDIYDFKPEKIVSDMHPDYQSTKYAEKLLLPALKVQHHHAHILSCLADNQLEPPVLGVSWDGTGFGYNDTIWGGEFLKVFQKRFIRVAHLRHFRLPGGETAIKEPRRSAIGLLYEIFGEKLFDLPEIIPLSSFDSKENIILKKMLENNINSPVTSSMGRLFDAIASIIGLCQKANFEGEAAMQLEFAADKVTTDDSYSFDIHFNNMPYLINWEPVIRSILEDLQNLVSVNMMAVKFHNALAELIISIAIRVNDKNIVLSGGCFQNKYLLEKTVNDLRENGLNPFWHKRIPTNDGGIALGQIMAMINLESKEK